MLRIIDKLASTWLNWRTDKLAEQNGYKDPELVRVGIDKGNIEIVMRHDAIAYLCAEAAAMLDEAHADNYIEFDMQPRIDQSVKPIRVTIQWAHGISPATKANKLTDELDAVKASYRDFVDSVVAERESRSHNETQV